MKLVMLTTVIFMLNNNLSRTMPKVTSFSTLTELR